MISDGTYVMVLRQSIGVKPTGGGCSADTARKDHVLSGGEQVPLVRDTLLCDRFLLVDGKLKPVLEVRSRHATRPESAKDALGTEDMEGRPFYEPARELSVRNLKDGRFTAVRVPTATNEMWQWQLFAHDRAERVHPRGRGLRRLRCDRVHQQRGRQAASSRTPLRWT
ncbi:hypothetical protein [Streptosporangium sp. NPDC049644]|uniref:hypothetical protein n=1 Tax=Streptosporangium sp. NPDC049644 TaxID=3155507 RepID=UPI00343FD6C7